jgi:hypothetical protein
MSADVKKSGTDLVFKKKISGDSTFRLCLQIFGFYVLCKRNTADRGGLLVRNTGEFQLCPILQYGLQYGRKEKA